jgi:hypothetical protein
MLIHISRGERSFALTGEIDFHSFVVCISVSKLVRKLGSRDFLMVRPEIGKCTKHKGNIQAIRICTLRSAILTGCIFERELMILRTSWINPRNPPILEDLKNPVPPIQESSPLKGERSKDEAFYSWGLGGQKSTIVFAKM